MLSEVQKMKRKIEVLEAEREAYKGTIDYCLKAAELLCSIPNNDLRKKTRALIQERITESLLLIEALDINAQI